MTIDIIERQLVNRLALINWS